MKMKRSFIITALIPAALAFSSCNESSNSTDTGTVRESEKSSPDNRNNENVNSGDHNDETTLQNGASGNDHGADVKPDSITNPHSK